MRQACQYEEQWRLACRVLTASLTGWTSEHGCRFYYAPGSLKARMTRDGNRLLSEFIEDRGLPIRRSGKLVVTRNKDELITLHELHRRGIANGIVSGSEALLLR